MNAVALIYLYSIIFIIILSIACGGFNFRVRYAYKVSDSVLEFIKNYFWSYFITYKQIRNGYKFVPEVNSKLEKLLSLALVDDVVVTYTTDYRNDNGIILLIRKSKRLDDSSETVEFGFQASRINGAEFLLSPSVFFLAQKVYERLLTEERNDKAERRKRVI
jgi:hypothetical protein